MISRLKRMIVRNEFLSLTLIILFGVIFGIANPTFFSVINLFDLLKMCVKPAIFACGVMIVLINGGIDMSFLWIGMFAAYSTSKLYSILQLSNFVAPLPLLFLTSMLIGAILGSFNALIISKFNIPVFIATLSSANIFMGIMFQFIGCEYIFPDQMPVGMIKFSNVLLFARPSADGTSVGLHLSVLVALVIMILTHLIMKRTTIGRSVYALGGDSNSAERIGINLAKTRLFIYMFAGLLAGLGGVVTVSNMQVANPYDFQGQELSIIAAVIIGGTRVTGGSGSIGGVALGVLLTNIISQNLILIGVPPEYNTFVFGLLIMFAVFMQAIQKRVKETLVVA